MAVVLKTRDHFSGGTNLTPGHEERDGEELAKILIGGTDDIAGLYAIVRALADKLDLDAGVTDTDYRAVIDALDSTGPRVTKQVV